VKPDAERPRVGYDSIGEGQLPPPHQLGALYAPQAGSGAEPLQLKYSLAF